jgi:hypothetical protein
MKLRMLCLLFAVLALTMLSYGGGANDLSGRRASGPVAALLPPYAPQVVARVVLKGQPRQIPQTPIFTTPSDGLFRISAYLVPTAASGGDQLDLQMNYTDEFGPSFVEFGENLRGPGCLPNQCSWISTFRAVGGSSISYSVTVAECSGCQDAYDLFFTVERLQ